MAIRPPNTLKITASTTQFDKLEYEFYKARHFWIITMAKCTISGKCYFGIYLKCLGPVNPDKNNKNWACNAHLILEICHKNDKVKTQSNFLYKFSNKEEYWRQHKYLKWKDLTNASKENGNKFSLNLFIQTDTNSGHCKNSTLKILSKLFNNKEKSDLQIICKEGQFSAHQFLLEASSPVFEAMLNANMKEKEERIIKIDDFEPIVVEELLRFIYTGKVEMNHLKEIGQELFQMADKYGLEDLKSICYEYLLENVSIQNIEPRLDLSSLYDLPELEKICKKVFLRNKDKFFERSQEDVHEFGKKFPEFVMEVLKE